jgi:hypothetical protein
MILNTKLKGGSGTSEYEVKELHMRAFTVVSKKGIYIKVHATQQHKTSYFSASKKGSIKIRA